MNINFSNHYYKKIEYIELFGYKIQTIDSALKLKEDLNRLKDKKDIQYILNFYKLKNLALVIYRVSSSTI